MYGPKTFLDQKLLWTKKFLDHSYRTPLFFGRNIIWDPKFFDSTFILISFLTQHFYQHFSMGLKINFQNRKWNYPNRKWYMLSHFKASNQKTFLQKACYFSHFEASDQKTSFTKCFSFVIRGSKLILKTGNGIVQTGNGIIYPTSRPPIKKLLLQNVSHLL